MPVISELKRKSNINNQNNSEINFSFSIQSLNQNHIILLKIIHETFRWQFIPLSNLKNKYRNYLCILLLATLLEKIYLWKK